jgi:hypothetical protein
MIKVDYMNIAYSKTWSFILRYIIIIIVIFITDNLCNHISYGIIYDKLKYIFNHIETNVDRISSIQYRQEHNSYTRIFNHN